MLSARDSSQLCRCCLGTTTTFPSRDKAHASAVAAVVCRGDTRGSGVSCSAPLPFRHPRRIPRVTEIPAKNLAEKPCKPHQMPVKPHRCRNIGRQWTRQITRHCSAASSALQFELRAETTRGGRCAYTPPTHQGESTHAAFLLRPSHFKGTKSALALIRIYVRASGVSVCVCVCGWVGEEEAEGRGNSASIS